MHQPRIYGPYAHRDRWKVVVIDGEARRTARVCDSYEEANDLICTLDAQLAAGPLVRIATALERYAAYLVYKGNKPVSIATSLFRLRSFFGDELSRPLRRLACGTCQRLYDDQVARTAVDTHRNALSEAKTFMTWCLRHRYLALNPLERIRPVGKRQHGKPQLRVDEARAWLRVARGLAEAGGPGAVAAMMALLMGMRCGEIVRCVARDVDNGGRLLWIPVSKTRSGKRVLDIPSILRRHLVHLAKRHQPLEPLFPHRGPWVRNWVRRICVLAGVPKVCAHAMRGLHSTLAIEAGVTPSVVAFALGHESPRATLLSYADPKVVASTTQRRTLAVLDGPPSRRRRGKTRGKDRPRRASPRVDQRTTATK